MADNYARMGFVGYVRFLSEVGGTNILVRAESADVKLSQETSTVDLVDGKADNTVYEIKPQEVGGNISFPLLHDIYPSIPAKTPSSAGGCGNGSGGASLARILWQYAVERDDYLRMKNFFTCAVRYADNLGYAYPGCLINQMTWTIAESQSIKVSCDVIGGANNQPGRVEIASTDAGMNDTSSMLSPARTIPWADSVVRLFDNDGTPMVEGKQVREFTCSVDNQIERFYGLNGKLSPVDIAAKKRQITGSVKTLGANYKLTKNAESNQDRFTANSGIAFGYRLGNSGGCYWATGLYGVIFDIEDISLSTGVFETTSNWKALGDCANEHLATKLGGSTSTLELEAPNANNYGAKPNNAAKFEPFTA